MGQKKASLSLLSRHYAGSGQGALSAAAHALPRVLVASRWMATPLALAAGVRLLVFFVADVGCHLLLASRASGPLSLWHKMDGSWYLAIAEGGYGFSETGQSSVNFFPLYPLTIHLLAPITRLFAPQNAYVLAGLVVSWLSFAAACILLYRIALDRFGEPTAYGAIVLLATFPFSFFYGAIYTESLYLALALAAFLGIDQRNWWLAAGAAGVAAAVRPPGIVVGLCVVVAYALDWLRSRHPLRWDMLALALTPLGAVAYLAYCWLTFHDPLVYMKANRVGWHGGTLQLGGIQMAARLLMHPTVLVESGDFLLIVRTFTALLLPLFVVALIPIGRLLGLPYLIYAAASFILPLATFSTVDSLGRYLSVIFPAFLVAAFALRARPRLRDLLCIAGAVFLAILAVAFVADLRLP